MDVSKTASDKVLMFSFGSNMAPERLLARIDAEYKGAGVLDGYELTFDKEGPDGTGKCNIQPSEEKHVWGVLYEVDRKVFETLDPIETRYHREQIEVSITGPDGKIRKVMAEAYIADADATKEGLEVLAWYLGHVLRGIIGEDGILPEYADEMLGSLRQRIVEDPDTKRREREIGLYDIAETPGSVSGKSSGQPDSETLPTKSLPASVPFSAKK